ncbi:MAG: NAD(P)-binding domain-containing protein [Pseudomonadota bacterium]
MKIGIIGAGDVAKTLGKAWQQAGHKVMISSRHPENTEAIQLRIGTAEDSARFGDVIVLAVNYASLESAIQSIRPHVVDKLVIDATNPLVLDTAGKISRVIGDDQIAGELMQARLPNARIAKAFTTLWTGHIQQQAYAKPRIAMTLAADEEVDRKQVATLIEEVGLAPLNLGTLSDSRPLDPPSPIWNVVLTVPEAAERIAAFRTSRR